MLDLLPYLFVFLLGGMLFYSLGKFRISQKMKGIRESGKRGEESAKTALESMGYIILEEQVRREAEIEVDGECVSYLIIGDLLVEKDGQTSIVEVKTGAKAPNPVLSATRRQLLEYSVSFPVDSIKLYDAEEGRLTDIRFPETLQGEKGGAVPKERSGASFWWFWIGMLLGGGLCFWIINL